MHNSFDVGHVDAVAGDFGAIGVNQQAGLAEFADDGEFGETGSVFEDALDFDGFFLEDIEVGAEDFHGEGGLEPGESFVHSVLGGLREIEYHAGIGIKFLLQVGDELLLGANGGLRPGLVVVGLEADIKLTIEKAGGIRAIVGASEFGSRNRDHGILNEQSANLGSKLGRILKRNGVREGGANPDCAFVEVRKELTTDERNKEEGGGKNKESGEDGDGAMVEAPIEAAGILIADPIEDGVLLFLDTLFKPVRRKHGNDGKREDESAKEREAHGVRHGMKEFSGRTAESINGEISGDDDRDGIEDGAVHVASGGEPPHSKVRLGGGRLRGGRGGGG